MDTGFLLQQLSNLTRTKVDKFVNILNYVSHAQAQDGTEDAQEIKFTNKSLAGICLVNYIPL